MTPGQEQHFSYLYDKWDALPSKDRKPIKLPAAIRRIVLYERHMIDAHYTFVPYINYGLLSQRNDNGTIMTLEQIRSAMCPSEDLRTPDLGTLATDLVAGHPLPLQVSLLKRFMESWKTDMNRFCPPGFSYYLPKHLGGLGIPILGQYTSSVPGRTRFSEMQLRFAAYLAKSPDRQRRLTSLATVGHSESLSLWKRASRPMKHLTRNLESIEVKRPLTPSEIETESALSALISPLLLQQLRSLTYGSLDEFNVENDRYAVWRRNFTTLFRYACKTRFIPLTEQDVLTDIPWRKVYCRPVVVTGCSKSVDLRRGFFDSLSREPIGPDEEPFEDDSDFDDDDLSLAEAPLVDDDFGPVDDEWYLSIDLGHS
jgi:hypothetical protein